MKTFFLLLLTLGISAATLYAASQIANPFPAYGLLLGIWVLFSSGPPRSTILDAVSDID